MPNHSSAVSFHEHLFAFLVTVIGFMEATTVEEATPAAAVVDRSISYIIWLPAAIDEAELAVSGVQ